ncbi:hypothetical protein FB45DRAFT_840644 [Roridomyces roridus]|uniref:Uncharacterized protein n=1 Tax=Roridomyces roridus TaxID=1738132 RepID=A0AAD7BD32_9AGAR|nr:hypothetical protein FB45DRAFT_840644 [Roridomyces roridus]
MAAELPPQILSEIQLSGWVFVASSAVLVWDVLNSFADDYAILFKHKLRLSALAYASTKIASLVYVVGSTIFTTHPIPDCHTAFLIFESFYPVVCFSISLLFFFRVRAIYGGDRSVTAVFGFLCACVLGGTMAVPISPRASLHPIGKICAITTPAPHVGAGILPANDTAVFLTISFRLLANSRTKQTRGESVKALFGFQGLTLPAFSRALFTDGQKYFMVTVVSNLVTVCMVYIPGVSPVYHGMLTVPNIALSSIMACRVYRNTTLRAFHEPSVSLETISQEAMFTIPLSGSVVHFTGQEIHAEHGGQNTNKVPLSLPVDFRFSC